MRQRNIHNDLVAFLSRRGLKVGMSPHGIERQLCKVMGEARYDTYVDATDGMRAGSSVLRDVYKSVSTLTEVGLLLSHQADAFIKNSLWLTQFISTIEHPVESIVEFGCGPGLFTAWLGNEFQDAQVFGVDRESHFIEMARQLPTGRNTAFIEHDYQSPTCLDMAACDVGVTCFGIDFIHGHETPGPLGTLCDNAIRESYCHQSAVPFKWWRSVVKDSGTLLCILRLSGFSHFMGVIDSAIQAGWSICLEKSDKITAGDERFPSLVFEAKPSCHPSDSELLSYWVSQDIKGLMPELTDSLAIAVFESIHPKEITQTERRLFPDGHTMECRIGVVGPLLFLFACATTGFARLQFAPWQCSAELRQKASRYLGE